MVFVRARRIVGIKSKTFFYTRYRTIPITVRAVTADAVNECSLYRSSDH